MMTNVNCRDLRNFFEIPSDQTYPRSIIDISIQLASKDHILTSQLNGYVFNGPTHFLAIANSCFQRCVEDDTPFGISLFLGNIYQNFLIK